MIFREEVIVENRRLIIKVSCKKRKYALEEKKVYVRDIEELIPENLKSNVKLIESPQKHISNIDHREFSQAGQWVFAINTKKKPASTSHPHRRKAPVKKKLD